MTVQDVRDSDEQSLLHIAAWLFIVSMQYATLDNAQHNGPFKLCASLGPRPSRDSLMKDGLVSNVGILGCAESLKLSCDIKVVQHGTRMRGPADRI